MSDLPRMAWMDDEIRPFDQCGVSLADRGLLFGESIYEVIPVTAGRVRLLDEHLGRMQASASMLGLAEGLPALPMWERRVRELIGHEGVHEGIVYAQVTGGTAPRSHVVQARPRPTFFAWVKPHAFPGAEQVARGIRAVTAPDIRWARNELKTTMLLPALLSKRRAQEVGAEEVIFVADGFVREGGSTNVFVVEDGRVTGVPDGPSILPGITGRLLGRVAAAESIDVTREPIEVQRMLAASEVFVTATTQLVMPVVAIDDRPVGSGRSGPVATALAAAMRRALGL
jgi:D-alanine transaminase